MPNAYGVKCKKCGYETTVDYRAAKAAEAGEMRHTLSSGKKCGGLFKRVWGATGHIWVGANGIDLGSLG